MKKLLLTMLAVMAAQSCFAGLKQYHDDNCYVSTDKCKLFEVMNIRSGWRVLLPSHVHEGWLFKLRNGSLVNVVEFCNIISGILGTNGKYFYIATDSLGDSPDWRVLTSRRHHHPQARLRQNGRRLTAAGPTKEELESGAHDAEIRANNERALKELNHE